MVPFNVPLSIIESMIIDAMILNGTLNGTIEYHHSMMVSLTWTREISESTKNGLKHKINQKNQNFFFAPYMTPCRKNLAEKSPKKFSPKISESTKNGLKRKINRKNQFFFLAP